MCLAIPGKVRKIFDDHTAEIEIVGDYVLLHAGFAIEVIDQEKALEIFRAWEGKVD